MLLTFIFVLDMMTIVRGEAMNKLKDSNKTFEDIKHINEFGNEYWEARELQITLEYAKWQKFLNVIEKAKTACFNSDNEVEEHFTQVGKLSKRGNNTVVEINDYTLSRYACYLIVQNGDPRKKKTSICHRRKIKSF